MKMQTVMEKKTELVASLPSRTRSRLRKQMALHGVPEFALRWLEVRHQPRAGNDTTLRYRHD